MTKLTTHQIKKLAKEKVAAIPDGVRWSSLVKEILAEAPDTPINTIWGSTRSLFIDDPEIVKVSKGIYAVLYKTDIGNANGGTPSQDSAANEKSASEKDFYEPFATWLRDGLDEVTEALAIGGNILRLSGILLT